MRDPGHGTRVQAAGLIGGAVAMAVLGGLVVWSLTGGHPLGRLVHEGAQPAALEAARVRLPPVPAAKKSRPHKARDAKVVHHRRPAHRTHRRAHRHKSHAARGVAPVATSVPAVVVPPPVTPTPTPAPVTRAAPLPTPAPRHHPTPEPVLIGGGVT
jgi:hypothetical protein